MKLISLCLLLLFITGCATVKPEVIYRTEYQEVKVPIIYKIDRPKRPKYTTNDNTASYMLKLKQYVIILETIIDEHNKKD